MLAESATLLASYATNAALSASLLTPHRARFLPRAQLSTIQSELRPLEGSAKRGRLRGFGLGARPAPRLRSWSEAGSAASVLEWHFGGGVVFDTPPPHRLGVTACWCVKRTNPSSAQVPASTCHSPWVTLKARPAPGPHQARTRPAPGPRQARARVFFRM